MFVYIEIEFFFSLFLHCFFTANIHAFSVNSLFFLFTKKKFGQEKKLRKWTNETKMELASCNLFFLAAKKNTNSSSSWSSVNFKWDREEEKHFQKPIIKQGKKSHLKKKIKKKSDNRLYNMIFFSYGIIIILKIQFIHSFNVCGIFSAIFVVVVVIVRLH